MKSEWTYRPLGELVSFASGGTPSKKRDDYWDGTIPWISAKTLKTENIDTSDLFITEEGLKAGSKIAPKGSILLLTRGSGLFNGIPIARVEKDVAFNQDIKCLDSYGEVENEFIFYWLLSQKDYLMAKVGVTGIGAGKFDLDFLQKLMIPIPSERERKSIVGFASSISEKIRCNAKVNDNLSDLLQTIYQRQFGKVGLANNCGILADICSYSKDKIEISKLGLDTYYSTENMLPEKSGAVKATSLPTTSQTTACHKGDTLVSNIRPYFKKIVYCEDDCGCSTDVLCFKPVHPRYTGYLFSTLYADSFFDFMVAGAKGTKMPRGDKQQIMTYPVVLPSEKDLSEFNSVATPILTQIYSNRTESEKLSAIRDTLLPKLILGEIDVSSIQL